MKLDEACRLLDVQAGDDERIIRAKYHKAVRRFHPDAAALDEEKALAMTKKLNAAFALVLKELRRGGSSLYAEGMAGPSGRRSRRSSGNQNRAAQGKQSARQTAGQTENEWAYRQAEETEPWPAETNPDAFCGRTIYAVGDLFSSMGWSPEEDVNDPDDFYESSYMTSPRPVASGKFFWDPDYESFPLFLYSLHQKCRALLQEEVIEPMLLHYLALEFIRPWECLRKIVDDYPGIHAEDRNGQTLYRFEAGIQTGRKTQVPAVLIPVVRRERIHLLLPSGEDLGHLSFEEDPLYYICLMILRAGSGNMQVTKKEASAGAEASRNAGRRGRLRLTVTLTSPADTEDIRGRSRRHASKDSTQQTPGRSRKQSDQPENHNPEIARLLAGPVKEPI